MTKVYKAVQVITNHSEFLASDAQSYGVGTAVWEGLKNRRDVMFHTEDGGDEFEVFIPFHSVTEANLSKTTQTVPAPVDAVCVTE